MISKNSSFCSSAAGSVILLAMAVPVTVLGQTPTESMSDTVESLCPTLKKINAANPSALTGAEKDVLFRCGEVKLKGGQTFPDFSSSQLNGLSNMTSDESSTMGTATVELSGVQSAVIVHRLATLRNKSSISVASSTQPSFSEKRVTGLNKDSRYELPREFRAKTIDSNLISSEVYSVRNDIDGISGGFSQLSDYGKFGFFLTGVYGSGTKDVTTIEPGFDMDSWSFVSGVDYRFSDQFFLGAALSYGVTDSAIDNNRGDVNLDGFGASVYGSYFVNEFYVDFLVGYALKDYETTRNVQYSVAAKNGGTTNVNQVFDGNTDADDFNIGFGVGYNLLSGGISITPYGQFTYLNSDIDSYAESLVGNNTAPGYGLALEVEDQNIKSLSTNFGVQLTRAISTSSGVLSPYLRVDWEHEFDNDSRVIKARFAQVDSRYDSLNSILIPTDEPDRDFVNLGLGVSGVFRDGIQGFLDYSTILALDDVSIHMMSVGLRMEF